MPGMAPDVALDNNSPRNRAVRAALADAGLTEYGPDTEGNAVALNTRRAARICIATERDRFGVESPVHFAFGATLAFNAFAHRTSADVICVNIGTVVALWNAVNALMADPDFLPFIEADNERPPVPPPAAMSFLEFCTSRPTRQPVHPMRDGLAKRLFASLQLFVITHELTHVFGGHVDLLHQQRPALPYAEVQGAETPESLLTHAMEYEADVFGTIRGLIFALENNSFATFDPYLMAIPDYARHRDDATAPMFFDFITAYLFFRLVDERYAADRLATGSHPLASMRQRYLSVIIPYYVRELGLSAISGTDWADIQYLAVREVEGALGRFADPGFSTADLARSAYVQAIFADTDAYTAGLSVSLADLEKRARDLGRGTFREFYLPRF